MQKDEAQASELLQKFRHTLNKKVAAQNGEIINNYGGGYEKIYTAMEWPVKDVR